jgi:hypothetical protein
VFHVKVVAPLAVIVAVVPEQIVGEFTLMVGVAFTVTVVVFALLQPLLVPVTV